MIVDVHSHFFSRQVAEKVVLETKSRRVKLSIDSSSRLTVKVGSLSRGPMRNGVYNLSYRAADRKRRRITLEVLSPLPMFLTAEGLDMATRFLRAQNREIARIVSEDSSRLAGLGAVPLQDVRTAISMVEEMRSMGLKGVEIGTSVNGLLLDDETFRDFFGELEDSRFPVFIHPVEDEAILNVIRPELLPAAGFPLHTYITIVRFIFTGLLDRFPRIRFLFAHGGGLTPYNIGRLDRAHETSLDIRQTTKRLPSEYLQDFYFDSITHSPKALQYLIECVGPDRVVVGTDYPFLETMGVSDPASTVKSLHLPSYHRERILWKNAEALFGLS